MPLTAESFGAGSLMPSSFEVTIRPHRGWQPIDLREIWLYRELLVFLVWRDIKIRYRQTLLGALWAVLQPLIAMLIFTFIFNRLAGVKSDGPPYPLFALAGLAPWTFFSTAVSQSSNSLVSNQQLVSKIYFPRVFIPLGSVGALLLDLGLELILLALLMVHYRWPVSLNAAVVAGFYRCRGDGNIRCRAGAFSFQRQFSRREVCGSVSHPDGHFRDPGDLSHSLYSRLTGKSSWA